MTISLKPNDSTPEKLQPTGWLKYLSFSLDHKVIGLQYLVCGFNKIDFIALNQGSSGPNTAEVRVYNENGDLVSANQWNLATGVRATYILVKE